MDEGIGRSGYRALASLLYALGLAALLVSLAANPPAGSHEWLAFSLNLAALTFLWAMGFLAIAPPRAPKPKAVPQPKRAPPVPAAKRPPVRDVEFEVGPPRKAPETLVLPPAFQEPTDPKAWPERRTGRTTRGELARRYTQRAPLVREILSGSGSTVQVPELLAMPGHGAAGGMARGKCGGCGMMLAAPPERPIRLRCPGCGKGTLLQ